MKAIHFRELLFRLVYSGFFEVEEADFAQLLLLCQEEMDTHVKEKDQERLHQAYQWIKKNRYDIQYSYEAYLENWTFDRLTKVDGSLLLVAAYELSERDDAPFAVVINESIELAKKYGGEGSSKFINGVLAGFVKGNGYAESTFPRD